MTLKLSMSGKRQNLDDIIHIVETQCEDYTPVCSLIGEEDQDWQLDVYFGEEAHEDNVLRLLAPHLEKHSFTLEPVIEKDWVAESQKNLKPVLAGRYFVHGAHDAHLAPANSHKILLEAATAFGTGHHGTTRGCLLALDHLAKQHHFERILDVGCGSGILAIAAAKKFKTSILASDIDPIAVTVTKDNIKKNQVTAYVSAVKATGFHHTDIALNSPYDLILANILAKPLCTMALNMDAHTHSESRLILSGILTTQGQMVEAIYRNHGFALEKRFVLGEWLTLILFRK